MARTAVCDFNAATGRVTICRSASAERTADALSGIALAAVNGHACYRHCTLLNCLLQIAAAFACLVTATSWAGPPHDECFSFKGLSAKKGGARY